jgi:hypothetical protein
VLGTGTVGSGHTATFRPASGYPFVGGVHNIVAQFGGNATFMASTSPAFVETVTKGAGTVVLAGKQADISGNTYTLAAVYTPSPSSTGFEPILGVMTFYDAVNGGASTAIATAVPNNVFASQGGYGLWTASGSATLTTPGTHVITAQYNDVNYLSAVSNSMTVYVTNTGSATGIYFPLPGTTLPSGTTTNFKWFPDGSSLATEYWLDVGSTPGGNNYYTSGNNTPQGEGTNLAKVVPVNWPNNGGQVCATLWSLLGGTWTAHGAACYTAAGGTAATINSPTAGSALCSTCVTFSWTPGSGTPVAYWIQAGTSPGGSNLYDSGSLSNSTTSVQMCGLPTGGVPIYVTLFTEVSNSPVTWVNNQYTYYTPTLDVVTSPPNGDPDLSGTQATFSWTNNNPSCTMTYELDISAIAPGGNDIWQSGSIPGFSVTNPATNPLPDTNPGTLIYVTLFTINGGNSIGYTQTSYTSGP